MKKNSETPYHLHVGQLLEKRCGKCGIWNPSDHHFCDECGSPLKKENGKVCPSCNESNRATAHYCGKCGKPLDA